MSLPTWECGLKRKIMGFRQISAVAPHVGVWIETLLVVMSLLSYMGRSPRGSVD